MQQLPQLRCPNCGWYWIYSINASENDEFYTTAWLLVIATFGLGLIIAGPMMLWRNSQRNNPQSERYDARYRCQTCGYVFQL
jgi:rubredoxin